MKNRNKKERLLRVICRGILMLTVVSAVFMYNNMTAQAAGDVEINEENFPDELFRKYMLESRDTDHNGILSEEERSHLNGMQCMNIPYTSIKGVEFFPNLTYLSIVGSELTEVDLSQNLKLVSVTLTSAKNMTRLDVSKNDKLKYLKCSELNLTELDLHNNKNLKELHVTYTPITELDLSENTWLTQLECQGLHVKELNLQNNTKLNYLNCEKGELARLDVSNCPELECIKCNNNELSSLDISNNGKLKTLKCDNNMINVLELRANPELSYLDCSCNQLEKLDVVANPKLETLWCESNLLTQLDVSQNKSLIDLNCNYNDIESLNVKGLTNIKKLAIKGCPLETVDISYNPYLVASYKRTDGNVNYSDNTTIITDQYENLFSDVTLGSWYDPAVRYVYLKGYMIGKGTKFGVSDTLTRQEFTQVLYNIAGKPEVTIENTYEDVVPGAWYEKSVLWAREAGIAKGKIDGVFFGINQEITREEMIQMLYAFAKWRLDSRITDYDISKFPDSDRVSSWARNAMEWAIDRGIISGKGAAGAPASEKLIDPQGHATRAECASIIMSYFMVYVEKNTPEANN